MDIFDLWRDQGIQSTNQRLMAENARLKIKLRISAIVYVTCLVGVTAIGLWKIYGGCK